MSLFEGSIELGSMGADCRTPDAIWHFEMHRKDLEVPNWGRDANFPSMWTDYPGYNYWGITSNYAPPGKGTTIPLKLFYGSCRPTQIIVSTSKLPGEFCYFIVDNIYSFSFDGYQYQSCYWQFGNSNFDVEPFPEYYSRMDNYHYSYPPSTFTNDVATYYEWNADPANATFPGHFTNYQYGPDNRCTWLITVDPSYGIDGNGEYLGYYLYPKPGTSQMGGWPSYFNGIQAKLTYDVITPPWVNPPNRRICNAYYGSTSGQEPADCNLTYTQNLNASSLMECGIQENGLNDKFYGVAIFRDRPMMTYEEFLCWHYEYDWMEQPGFK